jgi:hypothetical protein
MEKQTNLKINLSLGLMMFMQYMLFAIWWVPLAAYLANLDMSEIQNR